jgi:hypothetical protein
MGAKAWRALFDQAPSVSHGMAGASGGKRNPGYSYRICRDRRRPDGIASTMRQSPIITIPMNSTAKASTAILPG